MKNNVNGYCRFSGVPSLNGDHNKCSIKSANRQGYLDAFVVTVFLMIYVYAVG